MARLRKSYGADFKAKVAIAAIKAEATTNELKIDDAWVMQVIAEAQEEERRNPMTTEELLRESRALSEYGARQAKKVGIDVEDDEVVNRTIHEERRRWREKHRA
jgi:adenylate kinase family enzyme